MTNKEKIIYDALLEARLYLILFDQHSDTAEEVTGKLDNALSVLSRGKRKPKK